MRTDKMRQDNIKKVFSASSFLFATNGVANTSLEMIADKAELSLRSVVNYFGTRENLMEELRKNHVEKVVSALKDYISKEEFLSLKGKDKIINLSKAMVNFTYEKHLYICSFIEMRSMDNMPKRSEDEIIPPILDLHDLLMAYIEEGKKDGSISQSVDADELVPMYICTIKGMLSQYATVIKDGDKQSYETFNKSFRALYRYLDKFLNETK